MTTSGPRPAVPSASDLAWTGAAPLVALAVVGLGLVLGWRGVDFAAAVHRVVQFRADGFTLWDGSWYGGQWTLNYSVVFAPVAATLGLYALALVAAATSALSFERIVTRHFGPAARPATIAFALGTVVETAIGQLPFLSGEALALAAVWAATRRRWPLAWVLAAGATLLSPLAGAFAALAAVAWVLASHREHTRRWSLAVLGVAVAVGAPILVTTVLFPGEGVMPFDLSNLLWDVGIVVALLVACPRHERVLRTGLALYIVALVGSYLVPSPLGTNTGRLEDCLSLPVAVLVLWWRRRLLLVLLAVPLVLSTWGPAWGAMTSIPSQPSTKQAFYRPLDAWLVRADPGGTRGRVEVVPTADHWESVWVADVEPLARGWERQSDVTANPIFYRPGALTAASYRSWLLDNGVAYVALPAAPLDFAAQAEGRLVAGGVTGLRPVWHDRDWRVWAVTGSTGLVAGAPATVLAMGQERVVLRADRPGPLTVRVAWDDNWAVQSGDACATSAGRWTEVDVARPGVVTLAVRIRATAGRCPAR